MRSVEITLSYSGNLTEDHEIDLYDAAQALVGFQRSLALTTHLVLNNEIITQAPSLKGASILALPSEEGSWKLTAAVAVTIFTIGTAPKDTPIGHIISSAYDYVVSETLGFHVDYNKTLLKQYEEHNAKKESSLQILPQARFDSLIEKCEVAIREMHRPISKSRTATTAKITTGIGTEARQLGRDLNQETYEYISFTERTGATFEFTGQVSSYNINTFKGRIYIEEEGRPIPFELGESARSLPSIIAITNSLRANAEKRNTAGVDIYFDAFKNLSRTGRLKGLLITNIFNS